MMVSKDVLDFFFKLLYQESGLLLDESKKYLIETRLEPIVAEEGISSINALGRSLMQRGNPLLRQKVVDAMTTNETYFFRDTTPFDILRVDIFPKLMKINEKSKKIRIWCAASSSGQEPYSLAILIQEMGLIAKGWDVQIVASDISESVLKQARKGIYTQHEVHRGLSAAYVQRYFSKAGLAWQLKPEIRRMVEFRRLNLLTHLGAIGEVDIVLCRNILIYFDTKTKQSVVTRISNLLAHHGVLFLGGSEALLGIKSPLIRVEAKKGSYYRKEGFPQNDVSSSAFSEIKRRKICQT